MDAAVLDGCDARGQFDKLAGRRFPGWHGRWRTSSAGLPCLSGVATRRSRIVQVTSLHAQPVGGVADVAIGVGAVLRAEVVDRNAVAGRGSPVSRHPMGLLLHRDHLIGLVGVMVGDDRHQVASSGAVRHPISRETSAQGPRPDGNRGICARPPRARFCETLLDTGPYQRSSGAACGQGAGPTRAEA